MRFGLLAGLLGMAVAVLMTVLPSDQGATLASGGASAVVGAHSVGAADGGPGLPIVGWSTAAGDLRVAHFFGIHAMQALPLLGLLLLCFGPQRLSMGERARLTRSGGGGWIALTLLLTWQALRGQPVTNPDGQTLAVLAGIATITVVAVGLVLRTAVSHGAAATPGLRRAAQPSHPRLG